MKTILPLILMLLSGCAAMTREARMKEKLDEVTGGSIETAVNILGPPTGIFPNGRYALYVWSYDGPTVVSSFGTAGALGSTATGSGVTVASNQKCRFWLVVDDAKEVRSTRWEGAC